MNKRTSLLLRLLLAVCLMPVGPALVMWGADAGQSMGEEVTKSFVALAGANPWVLIFIAPVPALFFVAAVLLLRRSDTASPSA